MIQYTLKCDQGHHSDSWFQSAAAYDALEKSGHLSCATCGTTKISKALMAPRVSVSEDKEAKTAPVLRDPGSDVEKAVAELRRKVEETSDYVGDKFVTEARAMHLGEKAERSIYGEARLDQAKELIEEGVPLMPLPFRPKQKLT
ncbi:DUF1178 domain containing protein [Sulfitobacter noctilucicola]|uniref:DUF1178 family protein n=1 Tax=Sulfitobacter noctilucicola TaxID=1342301 RepID=A0A7W6M8Z3_9RHOB|nr:DUF1178 family protein [Sulfitobacter noctilucicola]KIN63863.1 DUF1178 domain containing protein [Sulfitobacter noctilucicola]MBB4174630.1 hypothetical protein [Sulfitobacter noctilucicola]